MHRGVHSSAADTERSRVDPRACDPPCAAGKIGSTRWVQSLGPLRPLGRETDLTNRSAGRPVAARAQRRRRTARGVLLAAVLCLALVPLGCDEDDETCAVCPTSSVELTSIFAEFDSVAIGTVVRFWALPELGDQTYYWGASGGRFLETDEYFARWKAPDTPMIVKITATASNDEESAALSVPIAVATYLPGHEPTYTGAGYCGVECHQVAGHGANYDTWRTTAHAGAFAGLEEAPAATPDCAACHAVGYGDTNAAGWARHNGGFDEIPIARLEGVQCESCHGPLADRYGEIYATHGDLALGDSLYALGAAEAPLGCARCHGEIDTEVHPNGKHHVAEWNAGPHAAISTGVDPQDPECAQCHTARGFLARLAGTAYTPGTTPQPLTCVACHDPHGSPHVADLRAGFEQDVCSRCHTDAAQAALATPHAPQAQMLAGNGGHEYTGYTYGSSPHVNISARGCATCHYPTADGGESHTFAADTKSCQRCHPQASGASFEWAGLRAGITNLLNDLEQELSAASSADSLTDAFRRAEFNYRFVLGDGSVGAHNHAYAKSLLEATLENVGPYGLRK